MQDDKIKWLLAIAEENAQYYREQAEQNKDTPKAHSAYIGAQITHEFYASGLRQILKTSF